MSISCPNSHYLRVNSMLSIFVAPSGPILGKSNMRKLQSKAVGPKALSYGHQYVGQPESSYEPRINCIYEGTHILHQVTEGSMSCKQLSELPSNLHVLQEPHPIPSLLKPCLCLPQRTGHLCMKNN